MLALWTMLGFLFAACMHENHALPALSLICCAWAYGRKVSWVIIVLTGLIVGNIILHDMDIMCFLNGITNSNGQTWFFWPIPTANNLSLLTVLFAAASIVVTFVWLIKFLQLERKVNDIDRK